MGELIRFKPFQLYRLFDGQGELLYVGITNQNPPEKRLKQHAKDKPWYYRMTTYTMVTLRTIDRAVAEEAERLTIISERPRYNNRHNGKRHKFAHLGHGFTCEFCKQPASYVICELSGHWTAFCWDHEPDDDMELFSIRAENIGNQRSLAELVRHLQTKNWFDFNRFVQFLTKFHDIEAC